MRHWMRMAQCQTRGNDGAPRNVVPVRIAANGIKCPANGTISAGSIDNIGPQCGAYVNSGSSAVLVRRKKEFCT